MLDINSTQISALKTNTGSTHQNFESDSHGVAHWGSPEAPLGGFQRTYVMNIRHVGYQFYSDFSSENEYRVNTPKFRIRLPWGGQSGFPRGPLERSPNKLMKIRHVGHQFDSDFSTENEYRVNTPKF